MQVGEYSMEQSGYLDCHRVAACEQGRPGVPALSTRVPEMGTTAKAPAVRADAATVLFGSTRRRILGSRNEDRNFLQVVERDIVDSATVELRADWRMNIAYNAGVYAATAALSAPLLSEWRIRSSWVNASPDRADTPPLDQAGWALVAGVVWNAANRQEARAESPSDDDELPRVAAPEDVEQGFELQITGFDVPFIGIIDLVAALDGVRSVIEFKTSVSCYQPYEVVLFDQLTAYRLAAPSIPQAALCVFVKTRTPQIEWHLTTRTGVDLAAYLTKVQLVARAVGAADFYRRPGKWCSWCDYLPVCLGDQAQVDATLVSIE
jgi:hypothetical protein